jgi:hypothetical protein
MTQLSRREFIASRSRSGQLRRGDLSVHARARAAGSSGGIVLQKASPQAIAGLTACSSGPLERSETDDGGPLAYRIVHSSRRWRKGERPALVQQVIEGNPGLGL